MLRIPLNPTGGARRRAAIVFIAACASLAICTPSHAGGPDGTWRLAMRKLPDGTVLKPPAILGMSTVKNGVEHIVVYWTTPEGKPASVSEIFRREWGHAQSKTTPMLKIVDDGSGKAPEYQLGGATKITPITRMGTRVSYQHPLDPPFIEENGDTVKATIDGVVDYWERVR
jgi:hypothetical protein